MPNNLTLIDSSFLYALYNNDDQYHEQAVKLAKSMDNIPAIPEIILPEVTFLFARDEGHHAIILFLEELVKTDVNLIHLLVEDIKRAQAIMATYGSSEFDLADACIMALSERLQITQVCTFDRRDFSIFRPAHCAYLELLP